MRVVIPLEQLQEDLNLKLKLAFLITFLLKIDTLEAAWILAPRASILEA